MKQTIMMLCLSMFSLVSSASGWVGPTTIENYYVSGSGNLHIRLSSGDIPAGVQSCSNRTYVFYAKTDSNFPEVFASVMAANANGGSMDFFVAGCKGGSNNKTYPHGLGFTAT